MKRQQIAALASTLMIAVATAQAQVPKVQEKGQPAQKPQEKAAGAPAQKPQEKAAAVDTHGPDRAAIQASIQGFLKALAARDAKAAAGFWTAGGEYKNLAGETTRGREALEKGFAEIFGRTAELKVDVDSESIRFLSNDLAIDEGTITVRRGSAEPESHAAYRATMVREGGRWLFAELSESARSGDSIKDLAWLIGEWKSIAGQGAEIRTTYEWAPSKKFIHARFSLQEKGLSLTGFQVIGVDPQTGQLHTWTFEADGGIGEADWARDGDHWVLDAAGTLPNGRTLVETNVLRKVDADTFTWQSVNRSVDDRELDDLPPVKVTRIKAAK
ncbi:MAG: SgcJ/EcaC family oxidoreductase [Isosphaeraceae bacterium]